MWQYQHPLRELRRSYGEGEASCSREPSILKMPALWDAYQRYQLPIAWRGSEPRRPAMYAINSRTGETELPVNPLALWNPELITLLNS